MVYDTKNRILHTGVFENVKLSEKEHRLLICLSSENVALYSEILAFLNEGSQVKIGRNGLSVLLGRLMSKTKFDLRVKVVRGKGYLLESEIFYE